MSQREKDILCSSSYFFLAFGRVCFVLRRRWRRRHLGFFQAGPDASTDDAGLGQVAAAQGGRVLDDNVPEAASVALVEVASGQVKHGRRVLAAACKRDIRTIALHSLHVKIKLGWDTNVLAG